MNDQIRVREVRLVGPDGNQLGIKPIQEALTMSRALDMDLVEVAPMARPPVAKIMDYGKFKFDQAQRTKESKRKASATQIKEMKYRPKIGVGDFDTKTRQVGKFLAEGHKVKVTIMFRGREIFHPELGQEILERVIEGVKDVGKVETFPKLDGRNMLMVLVPEKRPVPKGQSGGSHSSHSSSSHPNGDQLHGAGSNGVRSDTVASARTGSTDDGSTVRGPNSAATDVSVDGGASARATNGGTDGTPSTEAGAVSTTALVPDANAVDEAATP
ncbi:translation initiation factor IF-3 [Ferrimicrobium sp.]|uniref:translation initiation factor IF-3 n=1 Tax=Ferrimicrobium sp. TaxID=2926050 RepID=UPI002637DC7C|nr:translation initiation factor IF-3 [Ferrimicrobium sp.]